MNEHLFNILLPLQTLPPFAMASSLWLKHAQVVLAPNTAQSVPVQTIILLLVFALALCIVGFMYLYFVRKKNALLLENGDRAILNITSISQREKVFQTMFENANDGYMVTDEQNHILWVNPAFVDITGYSEEEIIGKTPRHLRSGWHKQDFYHSMWHSINENGEWSGQIWNQHKNGGYYLIDISIREVRDEHSQQRNYVGTFVDITQYNQLEAKLSYQMSHDQLTDLPTRTMLEQRFTLAQQYCKQHGLHIALLYLNIDHFHEINERYGYHYGDRLLRIFAERLAQNVRASSTVSRISGDEFVILLPDLRLREDALLTIERLRKVIGAPYDDVSLPLEITFSVGICFYPEHGEQLDCLLSYASRAMNEAKLDGSNQTRIAQTIHQ